MPSTPVFTYLPEITWNWSENIKSKSKPHHKIQLLKTNSDVIPVVCVLFLTKWFRCYVVLEKSFFTITATLYLCNVQYLLRQIIAITPYLAIKRLALLHFFFVYIAKHYHSWYHQPRCPTSNHDDDDDDVYNELYALNVDWMVQNIKSSFLTFNEEKLHYTCYYSVFSILLRSSSWLVFLKAYSLFFLCEAYKCAYSMLDLTYDVVVRKLGFMLSFALMLCLVVYTILCWVYYHHITIVVVICTCCCFFGLFCCTYPIQFNSRAVTFCVEN